jgi:hypothetical protein
MQIGSGGSIVGYKTTGNANELFIGANVFENTSGTWTYIQSISATQYLQINGSHIWRNAPSGTAGNAISFTQAMTLFANGNLGVGVGGSDAGFKLDVNGTGRFSGALTGTSATFSSTITTGAPSGGTAKPFKIGNVATVTPTLQNRTIEIEIDGTTYYLTAKTTNN